MKIIHISDTHSKHNRLELEDADVIVHSGDFSHNEQQFYDFVHWYSSLEYKHKILIAGNHDGFVESFNHDAKLLMKELGIVYLEDSSVIIDGIKFYGSPWTPNFCNWHFMTSELKLEAIYKNIDKDTDVLITHGPAKNILDTVNRGLNVGSESLGDAIYNLNIQAHLFGHIHEDYGLKVIDNIIRSNASVWEYSSNELNKPNILYIKIRDN